MERATRRRILGVATVAVLWTILRQTVLNDVPHPTTLVGRAMMLAPGLSQEEVARRLGPPTRTEEGDHNDTYEYWETGQQRVTIAFGGGGLEYATATEDRRRAYDDMLLVPPPGRNGPRNYR